MTRSDDLSPLDVEAVKVLIAHTRTDITSCHCGWGSHAGQLGQSHALHVWRELQQAVLPSATLTELCDWWEVTAGHRASLTDWRTDA